MGRAAGVGSSIWEVLEPRFLQAARDAFREAASEYEARFAQVEEDVVTLRSRLAACEHQLAALQQCPSGPGSVDRVRDDVKALQDLVEGQDRAMRAMNLVVHNLEEDDGGSGEDTKAAVLRVLPVGADLLDAQRLGQPVRGARPRTVLLRFASKAAKHRALRLGKDLRKDGVRLDVDLTVAERRTRAAKRDRFAALRQAGLRPFWRGAEIFIAREGQTPVRDTGRDPVPPAPGPDPRPSAPPGPPPPPCRAGGSAARGASAARSPSRPSAPPGPPPPPCRAGGGAARGASAARSPSRPAAAAAGVVPPATTPSSGHGHAAAASASPAPSGTVPAPP